MTVSYSKKEIKISIKKQDEGKVDEERTGRWFYKYRGRWMERGLVKEQAKKKQEQDYALGTQV